VIDEAVEVLRFAASRYPTAWGKWLAAAEAQQARLNSP
jgi:hypothetical protein